MTVLIALAIPLAFYLVPALLPIWRPFLIAWALLAILLIAAWLAPAVYRQPQDSLAAMIDQALLYFFFTLWLAAGSVQAIRGWARARNYGGYLHWPLVATGGGLCILTGLAYL